MLYLKLMSCQNQSDSSPTKNFTLMPVSDTSEITFQTESVGNGPGAPDSTTVFAILRDCADDSERRIYLAGNAYVLNAQGKTIASHAAY